MTQWVTIPDWPLSTKSPLPLQTCKHRRSLGQDGCERGRADLQRVAPQIIAVDLNQVEGVEEPWSAGLRVLTGGRKRENMTLAEEKALLRHFAFDLSQVG